MLNYQYYIDFFTEGFWVLLPLVIAGIFFLTKSITLLRKLFDPKVQREDRPTKGAVMKQGLLGCGALLVYMVLLVWPMGLYNTIGRDTVMDIKRWIPILGLPVIYIFYLVVKVKSDTEKLDKGWLYVLMVGIALTYLTLPGEVLAREQSFYRTMAQDTDVSLTVGVYGKTLNMPEMFPDAQWSTGENRKENWTLKAADSYEWIAVFNFGFSNKIRVYELPEALDKPRIYEVDGKHYVFCVDGNHSAKGLVIEMPEEVAEHIIRCGLDPQPDPPKEKPQLP